MVNGQVGREHIFWVSCSESQRCLGYFKQQATAELGRVSDGVLWCHRDPTWNLDVTYLCQCFLRDQNDTVALVAVFSLKRDCRNFPSYLKWSDTFIHYKTGKWSPSTSAEWFLILILVRDISLHQLSPVTRRYSFCNSFSTPDLAFTLKYQFWRAVEDDVKSPTPVKYRNCTLALICDARLCLTILPGKSQGPG